MRWLRLLVRWLEKSSLDMISGAGLVTTSKILKGRVG